MVRPSDRVRIIVFPFEGLAKNASLAWLGEGLAVALSDQLRMPGVDVVDQSERVHLVEAADLPPNAPLSRASMIRIAQVASANLLVMGAYSGNAVNLKISLHLFDLSAMKLSGEISANGPQSAASQMENELSWNILANSGLNKLCSREEFKDRTRKIPDSAYAYYVRSLETLDEGQQVKLLDRAVALYRDFPDAHFRLGLYCFQQGQCAKAVQHLELGRRKNEAYLRGDFMLGTCYLESDSLSDAIRSYSSLLAFGRPIEALNNLGVAYLRNGDYSLAIEELLEARSLEGNNLTVALNLALLRHLQGNESAARSVLDEAIRAHPDSGMAQFILSLVSSGSGDAAEAALSSARNLGVDVEKLKSEDPKSLARIFTTLALHP